MAHIVLIFKEINERFFRTLLPIKLERFIYLFKKHSLLLISFLFANLIISGCNKPQKSPFESPVVTINNESLSALSLSQKLVQKYLEQDFRDPKDEVLNILKQQIVEDFVIQKIFSNYAKSKNILVKKKDLDVTLQKFISSYPDPNSFEAFMKLSGQNMEAIKDSIRNRILRRLVRESLLKDKKFDVSSKKVRSLLF